MDILPSAWCLCCIVLCGVVFVKLHVHALEEYESCKGETNS